MTEEDKRIRGLQRAWKAANRARRRQITHQEEFDRLLDDLLDVCNRLNKEFDWSIDRCYETDCYYCFQYFKML